MSYEDNMARIVYNIVSNVAEDKSMMVVLKRRFGTIQWKLTGCFVLLSLLLTLTLIVITIVALILFFNSRFLLSTMGEGVQELARQMRPAFEDPNRTPASLGENLRRVMPDTGKTQQIGADADQTQDHTNNNRVNIVLRSGSEETSLLAALDVNGQVITSTIDSAYPSGAWIAERESPAAQAVISLALRGITDTTQLALRSPPGNHIVTAAPVFSRNGQLIGVLYWRIAGIPSSEDILSALPQTFLFLIPPLLLISGVIGLLYAWLAGRGFSRRLKRLTAANAALAMGNLEQRVQDNSPDEIGQLARQFNAMAEQLTENLRSLRMLADQNARLAEQAAQLAAVEERNRLARDLHDSVSQELFSLSMLAAATQRVIERKPELAAAQLGEIQSSAQRALQETRTLILALRPAALDGRGLAAALRDLAAAAQERQGLQVDLTISGERRLPLEHEQALFRIVQEALVNVVRHSGTRVARVALCYEATRVTLTISDQGRGFDLRAPRSARSIGLESMNERAVALGGTCEVSSTPSAGTSICVTLPVADTMNTGIKSQGTQ